MPGCGAITTTTSFDGGDLRNTLPRFTEEARSANQAPVDLLSAIAARKGATNAQIALAWLLAQHGERGGKAEGRTAS